MQKYMDFKNKLEDEDQQIHSYKIGRNELCPCGSGKKYKKCCSKINPEHDKEYFYSKIEEEKDEKKVFELLQEAVTDYPLEPAFILPLIVYNLQKNNSEQALDFMLRAWKIMGSDLDEEFIMPLSNLLVEKGRSSEAEKIIEKVLADKKQSSTLLMALGEVKKAQGEFGEVMDLIEKSQRLNPEDTRVLAFKMESFLDMNEIGKALEVWSENYDNLKVFNSLYIIQFLKNMLANRFGLTDVNYDTKVKEKLELALKVFTLWEEADNLTAKEKYGQALVRIEELKEIVPAELSLVIPLLHYYLMLGKNEEAINYAQEIEEFHKNNPNYYQILFRAYFNLENYKKAAENIKQAFKLVPAEEKTKRVDIIGDYLRLILTTDQEKVMDFIIRLEESMSDDEDLLAILFNALNGSNDWNKLVAILQKSDLSELPLDKNELKDFEV